MNKYSHPFCYILEKQGYRRYQSHDPIYQPFDWTKRIIHTNDNSNFFGCLLVREWHFPDHMTFEINGDLNKDGVLRRMTWQYSDWDVIKLNLVEREYRRLVNWLEIQ